jgi:MFS transporter, DHA2 family, metal-tetracycline-proton antiporter
LKTIEGKSGGSCDLLEMIIMTLADQRWLIFCIASGVFASVMSTSMLSIAFPDLVQFFSISYETLQYRNILFFTFFAVGLPFFGKITDRIGARLVYLTGLSLFVLSCLISSVMTHWYGFLFFQSTQAVADAMIVPAIVTLIRHHFPDERVGWAFGWFSATLSLATIVGPALGGLILKTYEWHALFLVLAFCALISLILGWIRIPAYSTDEKPSGNASIPWISSLSLLAGIIILQMFLLEPSNIGMLVAALSALGGFCYGEARHMPLLPKGFYWHTRFLNACVRVFLIFMVINTIALYGPSYLRDVHHWPTDRIGWVILVESVTGMLFANLAGRAADRYPLSAMGSGMGLSLLGISLLLWTAFGVGSIWMFLFIYLLIGIGHTLTMPAQNKIALLSVPRQQTGNYMGLFQMIQFLTGAFAAGVFGSRVETDEVGRIDPFGFRWTMWICVGLLAGAFITVLVDRCLSKRRTDQSDAFDACH